MKRFESTDLTPLDFCLWGLMKSSVWKQSWIHQTNLLARILDAAARVKKRGDKLRRTKRDGCARVAHCIEEFSKFIVSCNKFFVSV